MSTASEYIIDSLLDINALAPGQPLPATNGQVALRKLNDLLDSLSNDKDFIYTSTENITAWIPGQYKYSVGNPVGGTFSGTLIVGSPTIFNVTLPSNLTLNGDITDVGALIPPGTTIIAFDAPTQTVTLSANAIASTSSPDVFTYTTPGDIKITRPLRINSGSYTRITASGNTGLDYFFDIMPMERYNEIGYKGVPGPWPVAGSYQPTFPLGTLWVYPAPQQAGEVHLFTDLILTQFATMTTNVNLPQGYNRALKKLLAVELCPSWGKTPSPMLLKAAAEARAFIRSLNASPVVTLRYDSDIVRTQQNNAGWVMDGGLS